MLIDGIRQLYKTREGWLTPFPWCEEFNFQLDDIYTRLKTIGRTKTRGIATDETVSMSAIFKPHKECSNPRTVLIEGKPGMGKTTYCKKLVYDWATGKPVAGDCFPKFETVLLLKCRDINSNIWEAIDDQLLPLDIQEENREEFFTCIRQNQSSVLLVLDGLDELPAGKLQEFSKIIQGRVLPKCHLVVTFRPESGMKVRRYCDTLLEIEGFTEEDAEYFILKYFKNMTDLTQKLLFKLRKDKSLRNLTANPLNTALLCLLCEECQGIFPESSTQLYLDIMECVLRRFRRKKGLPETSEKLTELYKTELKLLGQIALNGLREGNLDFDESKLTNHNVELSGFGFLLVQPGGSKMRPCRRHAFLHKSFQEVFAAFYLCCELLNHEVTSGSLVSDARYFNELKQVLLFSCGILAVQCEETAMDLIANITTQVNKFGHETVPIALECIAECKREESNVHVKLARAFGSGLQLQNAQFNYTAIENIHFPSLAEAMKVNTTLAQLTLQKNNIGDAGTASLAEALKVNTALTQLDLSSNNIAAAGAASLAEAVKVNTTLTQLDLWDNNIGAAGAVFLAEALKVNRTLTLLDLYDNSIGDAGAASLAVIMKVNTTLAQLTLQNNDMGAAGAAFLAEALKVNATMTQLDLHDNNIGDAGTASLAGALKVNTVLTQLDLQGNGIGTAGAASLGEAMKVNTTLTQLSLQNNNIGDAGTASLAGALKVNTVLTQLDLSRNNIGDAGAAFLAEAMKFNTTLTQLDLSSINIGAAGAASLAEAVKVNTRLTQLDLCGNSIGDAGAASLAEAMKANTTMSQLVLYDNKIGDAGAASLAEAMKVNTVLAKLDLWSNGIGIAGAASLAEAIKVNTTLAQLTLQNNDIGAAGAASLAEAMKVNATLTQLSLQENAIGAAGAASLAEAVKVNTTLTQLDLWYNNIGAAGAVFLAEALKVNTALTQLDLSSNNIAAAGAASLAEAVKVNTTLTQLDLWYNNIGAAGAVFLAEALKVNRTLTQLDLYDNSIGDAGAASLAEAMRVNTTVTVNYNPVFFSYYGKIGRAQFH